MSGKLAHLLALSSLAILATTLSAVPANAVSTGHHHLARQHPHEAIARKIKRDGTSKRCKKRSATSSLSVAAAAVQTTSSADAQTTVSTTAAPTTVKSSAAAGTTKAATSTSSAASSANTSSSGGSGKLCLAWPNGETDLAKYDTDVVGWMYSWNPVNPDPNHKTNIKFMPQLWGANQVDKFESVVKAGYADVILGFNEPNEHQQSNLSPEDGAKLWKEHIEPKRALGYKTCSPATSSNPNGFVWVADMLTACDGGCTFDCMAAHWYDVKAADFITYMTKWHDTYKLPVYITEFAPQNFNGGAQPTVDEIWQFYQTVMPWIYKTDWVEMACPFGFMHDMTNVNLNDQLMASSGGPTDLGSYLINGEWAK